MRVAKILWLRLRSLFSRGQVEQELDEELRYHLGREIEERIAAGLSLEDACYAALQSFRDIEQRKEECRADQALAVPGPISPRRRIPVLAWPSSVHRFIPEFH